jgi:hypothetical protein
MSKINFSIRLLILTVFLLVAPATHAYFTFTIGDNSLLFSNVESHGEARHIADLVQAGGSIVDNDGVLIIDGQITIANLTAAQRIAVTEMLSQVAAVSVSSYTTPTGVLRYQVRVTTSAVSSARTVSLVPTKNIVAPNTAFALRWGNAGFTNQTCELTATGPSAVTLPQGVILNTNGTANLTLSTVGDYLVRYQCSDSSGTRETWQTIKVSTGGAPTIQIGSPNCYINSGLDACTSDVTWDVALVTGEVTDARVTNITTQQVVSNDERGVLRPISLRYGVNTILFEVTVTNADGRTQTVRDTVEASALCAEGTAWNGAMCTGAVASDYWGIISDINFYGAGYAGMPQPISWYDKSLDYNHPANHSCQMIDFWACDVRDNQPPVQFEMYVDDKLVIADRTNIPTTIGHLVNPWWEGSSKYRGTPACGMSDHLQYLYQYKLPAYLKDNQPHSLKIKATRSDGLSKMVTFNGWNGHYDYGYPNTVYQNFSFKCAPEIPSNMIDLAGFFSFPNEVVAGKPQPVREARVQNVGSVALATTTRVAVQFDYNRDGMGKVNDFTLWSTVNNIPATQSVFPVFNDAVLPVEGRWQARIAVDPQFLIEPWSASPTSTHLNNWSPWTFITATADDGSPTATLTASDCIIPVNGTSCDSSVTWTSRNFIGETEVLQGATRFSTAETNTAGVNRDVTPTNRSFTIRDAGGDYLMTVQAKVSCATGSSWNMLVGRCIDNDAVETPPAITMTPDRRIIRYEQTVTVTVAIDAAYQVRCEVTGLGRERETFTHESGNREYVFTSEPLRAQQTIKATCYPATIPPVSAEIQVEVVPTQYEV